MPWHRVFIFSEFQISGGAKFYSDEEDAFGEISKEYKKARMKRWDRSNWSLVPIMPAEGGSLYEAVFN